jgi:hypothetical protein
MYRREDIIPFSSKKQSSACFATGGFGGKVDCEEWAHKTKYKHLPKKFKEWLEEAHPDYLNEWNPMDVVRGVGRATAPFALAGALALGGSAYGAEQLPEKTPIVLNKSTALSGREIIIQKNGDYVTITLPFSKVLGVPKGIETARTKVGIYKAEAEKKYGLNLQIAMPHKIENKQIIFTYKNLK